MHYITLLPKMLALLATLSVAPKPGNNVKNVATSPETVIFVCVEQQLLQQFIILGAECSS